MAGQQTRGPAMICATPVLKPPQARIGSLGGKVTLPRTLPIITVFAILIGAFLGLALAAMIPGAGIQSFVYGIAMGGGAGWFVVTFSPLRGESLLTWMGLSVLTWRKQRYVEGRPVVIAVGTGEVGRLPTGRLRLLRGAVRVPAGMFDERGVPFSAANRNLDQRPHPGAAFNAYGRALPGTVPLAPLDGPVATLQGDDDAPAPRATATRPAVQAPAKVSALPTPGAPSSAAPAGPAHATGQPAPAGQGLRDLMSRGRTDDQAVGKPKKLKD